LRDLSLHLLDLLENSIVAGATTVWVRLAELPAENLLELVVEDDGRGMQSPERALDPFFTTKGGKRTGLGLPLLAANTKLAGGNLTLGRSVHGGLEVRATFQLGHVDRIPLGDIPGTLSMIACTHPELEICCELCVSDRRFTLKVSDLGEPDPIALARVLCEAVRHGQQEVGLHG
jgi:hypothetical protein